ncbi:MAG: hypothetical protein K2X77_14325 [Candidatus Obscuribacterales bacterium]|nr:hypothetical protein [Candidatus Obscuribacterales bacterium]
MSVDSFKKLISDEKIVCPKCDQPVRKFDKYVETIASVWDGAGDSVTEDAGAKVTLICANGSCKWEERTEYWENYLVD